MIINSVKLENFRNYEQLALSFDPGTNLFYGDNAQGKTNILEAVYLCGTTKSHRGSKDRDMIRFGQEDAHIRVDLLKHETTYRIDMHLKKNKSKGIAINSVPIRKAGELMGLGNFIFFSPEDLGIIKNGPSERRRFVDMELCQLNRSYLHDLSSYHRVLMQRNKLLKEIGFRPSEEETLDIWDEQLVRYGISLIRARRKFSEMLQEVIVPIHGKISGGREHLQVSYEQNVSEDTFREALFLNRENDLKQKLSHVGPHRDDLKFEADGVDLRRFGSQGQQRTAALSLKLAEIELVKQVSGDVPVLMLDDVLSELDSSRQRFLLESIQETQTMVTGTGIDYFRKNGFRIDRLFRVNAGVVLEDKND